MSGLPRRCRAAAVTAAATLLCLAGPAWSATAQDTVPPWVPPPVEPSARPSTAAADSFPYRAAGQVGPAVAAPCANSQPGRPDIEAAPPAQARLRIPKAQEFATGQGQTVAVIDSGVQPHPRLAGRLDDGGDYILGDTGTSDCEGHGTAVAGIIGATPDPQTGFVGVAPDARILSIRQGSTFFEVEVPSDDSGRTETTFAGDTTSMARAVVHAVRGGATVINISEAACYPVSTVAGGSIPDRDLQAAVNYAADNDVMVVAAAANQDDESCRPNPDGAVSTIVSPAWFDDDVLAVAATSTETGEVADFSIAGPWVDVAAPGTGIVSLDVAGGGLTATLAAPDGERGTIQGTSFAAPYVAGVAALVRERFPELSAREVMDRLEVTAQATWGTGGRNDALGSGVVNPVAALTDIQAAEPAQTGPARLEGFALRDREDPIRQTVALVGASAGVGLLGMTLLTVYTVKRYRRSKLAEAYRSR